MIRACSSRDHGKIMASEALFLQLGQLIEKTKELRTNHFRWMTDELEGLFGRIRDMLPADRYSPWLGSVRKAIYEAEDILDKFHTEALHNMALRDDDLGIKEKVSDFFSFSCNLVMFRLTSQRKMQRKVDNLVAKIENSRRETAASVVDREVISRDLEKVEIVKQLIAHAAEGIGGLTVIGISGDGKTALARSLYDDAWVVENFQLRLWISVSYELDVERITKDMIETATGEESSDRTLEELIRGMRYLLVLDDVFCRDQREWDELRTKLRIGQVGSTVIVTTSIPKEADERMWLAAMDDGFWRTMTEELRFFSATWRGYNALSDHARQCLAFCAVFPRKYEVEENDLIHMWMGNGLLILSGDEQCSFEVKGDKILNELTCSSFLKKGNKKIALYDIPYGYHNILMYKMPVLNQKLARNVMQSERATMVAGSKLDMIPRNVCHLYVETNCEFDILVTLRKFPTLRTLLSPHRQRNPFQHSSKLPKENSLKKERKMPREMSLRVLDLRGSRILKLPHDLGNLKQLRYLNLSSTGIKALPESVRTLFNLQTLNLTSCYYLKRLPTSMCKMISLRHLLIDGCERLLHMPSEMGKLTQLQTLSKYIIGQEPGRGVDELEELNLGGKLEIKGLKNVTFVTDAAKAKLSSKVNLQSVALDWRAFKMTLRGVVEDDDVTSTNDEEVLKSLELHDKLKSLDICRYTGASFSSWMMDSIKFQHLVEIYLRDCYRCTNLPPLAEMPLLEVIFLSKMNEVRYICSTSTTNRDGASRNNVQLFPSLKVLIISDLEKMEGWVENQEAEFVIPNLVELTVCNCPELVKLPNVPSIKYLTVHGKNRDALISSQKGKAPDEYLACW